MSDTRVKTWQGSAREALLEENRLKAMRYRLVSPVPEKELKPGQYMKRPITATEGSPQTSQGWTLTWCPNPEDI